MLRLPASFSPTHATAGLAGYPAIDVFGPAGTLVSAGFYGIVVRISGRDRAGTEPAGGAYGWSVYVRNTVTRRTRYVTHLDCLAVEIQHRISPGTVLGRVAAPPRSAPLGSDHVHLGDTGA